MPQGNKRRRADLKPELAPVCGRLIRVLTPRPQGASSPRAAASRARDRTRFPACRPVQTAPTKGRPMLFHADFPARCLAPPPPSTPPNTRAPIRCEARLNVDPRSRPLGPTSAAHHSPQKHDDAESHGAQRNLMLFGIGSHPIASAWLGCRCVLPAPLAIKQTSHRAQRQAKVDKNVSWHSHR